MEMLLEPEYISKVAIHGYFYSCITMYEVPQGYAAHCVKQRMMQRHNVRVLTTDLNSVH